MNSIFVCNAGSSSLKFSFFEANDERLIVEGGVDFDGGSARLTIQQPGRPKVVKPLPLRNHSDAIASILAELRAGPSPLLKHVSDIQAVGHRVVHGGDRYKSAVFITPAVKLAIEELAQLAPLHNPASLAGIEAMEKALPGIPQAAVFDTAFHATLPEAARTYPVPQQWTHDWHIRRYGFHGLSHAYCSARAAQMLRRNSLRLIIAHLGNGASMSAVRDGVCIDTSMGFTPLEGLMMGTRSGSIDPGVLIYLMRTRGLSADSLDHALNHESGLLGVSGISSDMRQVLEAATSDPAARLAVDLYVHRVRQTIGAMAATLGGVDALVFTAGVGENSAVIRRLVCENLQHLGIHLDLSSNESKRPDADIALPASNARVLVIATREDITIMRETGKLIQTPCPETTFTK